jgi:hypothetical protein
MFGQVARGDSDIIFKRRPGRYLGNYIIRSLKTEDEFDCSNSCLNEPGCVSVNLKVKGRNKSLCELNSKTLEELPEEGQGDAENVYFQVDMRVRNLIYIIIYYSLLKFNMLK